MNSMDKIITVANVLKQECPENDCIIFKNIFAMYENLMNNNHKVDGYAKTILDNEIRKVKFELETMVMTNSAVRTFYKELVEVTK